MREQSDPAADVVLGDARPAGEVEAEARVLTVPNALSLARLALLAVFALAVIAHRDDLGGAIALGAAGVTDFLDGYVARHFHQVTTLGKVLDPTVDRIMLATSVIIIVAVGALPLWLSVAILVREVAVALGVLVLAARRAPRIDVIFLGKAGTFGLMVSVPLLLAGHGPSLAQHVVRWVALAGALAALTLSYAAALTYLRTARAALRTLRSGYGHGDAPLQRQR